MHGFENGESGVLARPIRELLVELKSRSSQSLKLDHLSSLSNCPNSRSNSVRLSH